jgi:hypothetical protein
VDQNRARIRYTQRSTQRLEMWWSSLSVLASCLLAHVHSAWGSCSDDVDECDGVNAAADTLQYSVFMGMQYYGPPEPIATYHAIAKAAKKLAPAPFYISVCCDHNDAGGSARQGRPACRSLHARSFPVILPVAISYFLHIQSSCRVRRNDGAALVCN